MKKKLFLLVIAISALTLFSCNKNKNQQIITEEIQFTKEGELTIYSKSDSTTTVQKKLDIEIANNDYQIQTGLMYRTSMLENRAMLFVFPEESPRSFYMKNTEFPLDIIYIDKDYKIESVQKNAKPLDKTALPSAGMAKYVLEINGGLYEKWNLKVGDSISYLKM